MTHFFRQLDSLFEQSNHVLITSHNRPDGDAVGSVLGLAHHLDGRGKSYTCFIDDAPASYLNFLDTEKIVSDPARLSQINPDLAILLDIGDINRSRVTDKFLTRGPRPVTVNIDHHPTRLELNGQSVADHSLVDREASSTSEILYRYLTAVGAPVGRSVATSLLTGILTDTGGFSNLGTTIRSLQAAADLLNHGALIHEITERTLKNKSLPSLKLWGRALSRLKQDPSTGLVSTAIFQKDLADCDAPPDAVDGIANFLNSIQDAEAALLLKETPDGLISGSYRTTQPQVDVSRLAARYGGGGHAKAAGFTVSGRIQETENGWQVVPVLR